MKTIGKLIHRGRIALVVLLGLGVLVANASALIITGESATASTTNSLAPLLPIHAVDDSGLQPAVPYYTHNRANDADPTPYSNSWLSTTPAITPGGDPNPWFLVDLGDVYSITSFHVWNYNEGMGNSSHGITSADITYSTTNPDGTGSTLGTYAFAIAPGTGLPTPDYQGQEFPASFTARYVRFNINGSYDGGTGNFAYGLSEVQFSGSLFQIPEPSTALLVGLGCLMMGALGWGRRNHQ